MSPQTRLRWACRRGDSKTAINLLRPSTNSEKQADALFIYTDDAKNTLMHHLCSGNQIGYCARTLLGWNAKVLPADDDIRRSLLLLEMIELEPRLLLLACERNLRGSTPAHLCVESASVETLKALIAVAKRTLGDQRAALLLSVPNGSGASALECAIATQQWKAAELLTFAAPLDHSGLQAAAKVNKLFSNGLRAQQEGNEGPSTSYADEFSALGTGVQAICSSLVGSVGSAVNLFLDAWGSRGREAELVMQHRKQKYLHTVEPSADYFTTEVAPNPQNSYSVLIGLKAVEGLKLAQTEMLAGKLALTSVEAAGLLARHNWNEELAETAGRQLNTKGDIASRDRRGGNGVETAGPCVVCFEDGKSRAKASSMMPCFDLHMTCDICWKGILDAQLESGSVHRIVCPSPECALPLPPSAAKVLLRPKSFDRLCRLQAQDFVKINKKCRPCPATGCSNTLQLHQTQQKSSPTVHATIGHDVQCSCGHRFCWNCSEPAHEPANCKHSQAWKDELDKLRRASPEADAQWLRINTRRCPGCRAAVQKTGGCNHMTCTTCRTQWCWECGRAWREHDADTGGFYFCMLEPRRGHADSGRRGARGSGSLLGDIWRSLQSAASQDALRRALRQYLRHQCSEDMIRSVSAHLECLSSRLGLGKQSLSQHQKQHGVFRADGSSPMLYGAPTAADATCDNFSTGTTIISNSTRCRGGMIGPECLGFSLADAAAMPAEEWDNFLITACHSMVENSRLDTQVEPSDASPSMQCGVPSLLYDTHSSDRLLLSDLESNQHPGLDFTALAALIVEAHRTLSAAAATLRALSAGARRRYLAELCAAIETILKPLELVFMNLPHRDDAITCHDRNASVQTTSIASKVLAALSSGFRRIVAGNNRPVPTPPFNYRFQGLSEQALVNQSYYAEALFAARDKVKEGAAALAREIEGLKHAGRIGLFSDSATSAQAG